MIKEWELRRMTVGEKWKKWNVRITNFQFREGNGLEKLHMIISHTAS